MHLKIAYGSCTYLLSLFLYPIRFLASLLIVAEPYVISHADYIENCIMMNHECLKGLELIIFLFLFLNKGLDSTACSSHCSVVKRISYGRLLLK